MQTRSKTPNPTASSLLGFLHEKPMTAWALASFADARIGGFWNITRSQVYREINTLVDQGYITLGERGSRDERLITLTEHGREAFRQWILSEPDAEIIRFPLLLTTSFAKHLSLETLQTFIQLHQPVHQSRLEAYEKAALSADQSDAGLLLTYEFGIRYEKMVLGWMDEVIHSKS